MTEEKKKPSPKKPIVRRKMTVSERAEAVALWRSGTVTLEDLSKKFKKRPESLSRMFTKMGITKGAAEAEARAKLIAAAAEERVVSDVEKTLERIKLVKEENYGYARGLARYTMLQIKRAQEAGIDLATLKDTFGVLKLASEITGNCRKELYQILNVEKHEKGTELEELPELTIRELTNVEIDQLKNQDGDDMGLDTDPGIDMMPDDVVEGL